MNNWQLIGRLCFWLCWPALWLYLRPSQRTRVLVVCDGKVLVTKSWLSDGSWQLPGGGRHRDESAMAAVSRELREETGIDITIDRFTKLGEFSAKNHGFRYAYSLFEARFDTRPVTRRQKWEIVTIDWLIPDEIRRSKPSNDLLAALQYWSR